MNSIFTSLLKYCFGILLFVLLFSINLHSQPWTESLPTDKEAKAKLTLFDYQKAFNDYWAPFNVEKGYYLPDAGQGIENAEKQKAGGWKQFKRWEWFWESRVNPVTGEFPNVSAMESFNEYKSLHGGERSTTGNWTSMGPTSSTSGYAGIGRLNSVSFSPNDTDLMYAGAAAGGVWRTTDGGTNWMPIGDFNDAIGASDIVVVGTASDDILYLATGDKDHSDTYSVGVLKSTDGGDTWNTTALSWTQSQGKLIYRLIVDPNSSNLLYAATNEGVYKTSNAGGSWTLITTDIFRDLEFNPGNSTIIYGSTGWGGIYRSTNSGINWTQVLNVSGGRRTELAVSNHFQSVVYAVMANTNSALFGIYKSIDNGVSFTQVFDGSPSGNNLLGWNCNGTGTGGQGWYDLCIISDPNNSDIVFIGGVNTWKSTDAGTTWNISNHWSSNCGGQATNVHADKHYLAYQNGTSTLFECGDGGIYKTTDSGNTWTDLTNTMVISQMYRLGVAQTVPDDVVTGLQDNGTKSFESDVWDDVIGGDGMECAINYTNEDIQYGSLYYGDIKRTTNHWASYSTISNGISGSGAWVTPYLIDPNNDQTLYVGYDDVWKSTNQGNTWTEISNWNGANLRSLTVAPSNSLYIYAATYSSISKTTDGGSSWTDITSNLPVSNASITYISVKDDDPLTIWVSFGGFNIHGVYKSIDGGTSWSNMSDGLPQLPVNSVIQNKLNLLEEELYAATDVGVYVKIGSADWFAFYDGLPNVVVNELDIYYDESVPSNSLIRAATFGRGLWESDLFALPLAPVSDFVADNLTPTTDEIVIFTDLSSNNPTSWIWNISPLTFSFVEGSNQTTQNPQIIFNEAGFYNVTLTATNEVGSDIETKVDYIEASLAAPVTDFEADNIIPTTNQLVMFSDLSTNEPYEWLWEIEPSTITYLDGTNESSQNPTVRFDVAGAYDVSLTSTNGGGSDTETKNGYVNTTLGLSVTTTATPEVICQGEQSQLNANPDGGTGDFTFLWTSDPVDPSLVEQETLQNPIVSPDVTTNYTVEVADGVETIWETVEVTVNTLPEIILGDWPELLCNQLEPPVQLTAEPEGGIFSGNITEDGIFSPEIAPLGWNIITYSYEDINGCENSNQDSIFMDNCVAIENAVAEDFLNIFPNPNEGSFKIESVSIIKSVDILSPLGAVVFSKTFSEKSVDIDTDLKKGVYFVRIKLEDNETITKEIIVN